jgi:hypothetical protein
MMGLFYCWIGTPWNTFGTLLEQPPPIEIATRPIIF